MPRLLCLAQAHAAAKAPRARSAVVTKAGTKPASFTILEQVPVRLAAHTVVWTALRKHGTRQPIIDAEHPGEAFPAYVVPIDQLGADAVRALAEVLAERRSMALAAEKDSPLDILAKSLDSVFTQELEWLAIRNLLAAALRTAGRSAKRGRKPARVLLLIDG